MPAKTTRQKAETSLAKAMSHPDRAAALKIFSERTASTNEIAKQLGLDVRMMGYHVRKLRELECIEEVGTQQVRGAVETFYRATELPIVWTDEWDDVPDERKPRLIGEFTQAIIDNVVAALDAGTLGKDGDFWIGPTPLVLGREELQKLTALHDEMATKALELQAEFVERRTKGEEEEPIHVISAQAVFPVPPPEKS